MCVIVGAWRRHVISMRQKARPLARSKWLLSSDEISSVHCLFICSRATLLSCAPSKPHKPDAHSGRHISDIGVERVINFSWRPDFSNDPWKKKLAK